MSTMLKSAAMTLLSKTLQTFLYKYLLEVDVEGVALPSLMDTDGQSGWGVRLSNVRLREGVELMTLPGKRKVRRRKPKQQEKTEEAPSEVDGDLSVEEEKEATNMVENAPESGTTQDTSTPTLLQVAEEYKQQLNDAKRKRGSGQHRPRTTSGTSMIDLSDMDSMGSSGYHSSRPPTPPSSYFSLNCFHTQTEVKPEEEKATKDISHAPPSPTPVVDDEDDIEQKKVVFDTTKVEDYKVRLSVNGKQEIPVPQDDEEEDDMFQFEQDMVLRLGVGGRIGTLDVRLVGKEIHANVEDAFLVIEAVPKPEKEVDESGATKEASKSGDKTKDDGRKSADSPGKKSRGNKNDKITSVGDRVLEKNAIARALSAIPHLFLRDCRVQLIVRAEDASESPDDTAAEISNEDAVVEIGVELLSVTSGEDILAHLRMEEETPFSPGSSGGRQPESMHASEQSLASFDESDPNDKNEYQLKRIRTGKGPEGGIWIRIFPPGTRMGFNVSSMAEANGSKEVASQWALHSWMASQQMCLFRCSGLDIRSRIYMGKKRELARHQSDYSWYGNEFDEYTMDSMLFGVDYVAPGPPPPLPPLIPRGVSNISTGGAVDASEILVDGNGIQRYQVKSVFHNIARGLMPSPCERDHLPCENCSFCWEHNLNNSHKSALSQEHPLDSALPMPGVILNISINDPLEINVDRPGLEVLGAVKTLFTKNTSSSESSLSNEEDGDESKDNDVHPEKQSSSSIPKDQTTDENITDAFPSYMQPETIQVAGVHISKFAMRVHIMREDSRKDCGLSFCYWDMLLRCITVDQQKLLAPERSCQDVRFDLGEFTMTEHKGTGCKRLISLGLPHPHHDDESAASASSHSPRTDNLPPWPSTASALLNVPAPLHTLVYESREGHGLQMRYVTAETPGDDTSRVQSMVNLRVGTGEMDTLWEIKNEIFTVIAETKKALAGGEEEKPSKPADSSPPTEEAKPAPEGEAETPPSSSSLMKYKIRLDGGAMKLHPTIQVRLPLTRFAGEKSSETGFCVQTLLDRVKFEYGQRSSTPSTLHDVSTTLTRMAALPENVRLRILLFIPDLDPLERALGVKKESNSFLRYHAVNKKLVKLLAKKKSLRRLTSRTLSSRKLHGMKNEEKSTNRRQELMTKIMKLDDVSLEELWSTHLKLKRRAKQQHPKKKSP